MYGIGHSQGKKKKKSLCVILEAMAILSLFDFILLVCASCQNLRFPIEKGRKVGCLFSGPQLSEGSKITSDWTKQWCNPREKHVHVLKKNYACFLCWLKLLSRGILNKVKFVISLGLQPRRTNYREKFSPVDCKISLQVRINDNEEVSLLSLMHGFQRINIKGHSIGYYHTEAFKLADFDLVNKRCCIFNKFASYICFPYLC